MKIQANDTQRKATQKWKKLLPCVFFLFFIAAWISPIKASSQDLTPEQTKHWLRLLHYKNEGSGFESELDGLEFFFAPDGKTNPWSELVASREAFREERSIGRLKLHPQCAFPERFRFFREVLGVTYDKLVDCPKFKEFLDSYRRPTGVTVVFSSAYPNNPASMFGHTFLKFETSRKNDLLDIGINFAAYTPSDANLISFMYRGVFGGYPGMWSMEPYFIKVNEYVNSESRDLWEYELSLSEAETQHLLGHLWELEVTSYLDYFFLDENCSYQLLRAIEAVRLDWDLVAHLPVAVIPGETVKQLTYTPGAIRDVRFRSSLFHQLQQNYERLSETERADFSRLMNGEKVKTSPEALQAASISFLYLRAVKKQKWSDKDSERQDLVTHLQLEEKEKPQPLETPPRLLKSRPDIGHDPASVYLGGGAMKPAGGSSESFVNLKARLAYHDLLGMDVGYVPFSEIEFPWIDISATQNKTELRELGFVSSTSLFPLTPFDQRWSWKMRIALERERGLECQECLLLTAESGAGVTLGAERSRWYTLGSLRPEAHPDLPRGFRIRPVLEAGVILNPTDPYKMRLLARNLWSLDFDKSSQRNLEFKWDHSWTMDRNNEIRQSNLINYQAHSTDPAWFEAKLHWVHYFR